MAATVGATLTGASMPPRHGGLGPFISANDNTYVVARPTTTTLGVYRATDPMSAFTEQNTAGRPTVLTAGAAAVCQYGDVLHIVYFVTSTSVRYKSFSMATDTWSTEATVATLQWPTQTADVYVCSIVARSDGSLVTCYHAGLSANMTGNARINYSVRSAAGTWDASPGTALDAGGTVNYFGPYAVLGSADRVHFFWVNDLNDDLESRTLSAANALSTLALVDTTASTTAIMSGQGGTSYDDAGTTRVRFPYADATGISVAKLNSIDAPTAGSFAFDTNIATGTVRTAANAWIHAMVSYSTNAYFLYSDSTSQDLMRDTSTAGGAWGTDVNELTATINLLSANVYERANNAVIGLLLDDAATVKYAEIVLVALPQPSITVKGYPNYFLYY